ncbi:MAG: hypothetical protein DRR19_10925 [Candidatus Parabeggiatoa sp. nov. 1]|nr:MAG: hypothetical protein DRR19_10925 [Gammaproteobacteria bacterium]
MSTHTRRPLTRAIQQILRQPVTTIRPLQYATQPALLSLLLASQPALAAANFDTKFVEVPRLENPLKPPIHVGKNSKPTFADIDNDGDLDVFIGAGGGTVKYYENTGNVSQPIFVERTEQNNPLSEVHIESLGYSSPSPTMVDIDNDDDLDAFIGGKHGTVKYYENTGGANKPIFEERPWQNNPFNGIEVGSDSVPTLVDIDSDGDLDAFIGEKEGTVKYYENMGGVNKPIFKERTDAANPLNAMDVIKNSTPNFVDIDSDGDLDVFIGGSVEVQDDDGKIITTYGTVKYYENTGSASHAMFEERTDTANPFHGVDVGNNSAPAFIDIDNDSDLDAFIGAGDGTVKYYENQGTVGEPDFVERTKLDNPFGGIVDARIPPALVDIDNDGDLDVFTRSSYGPLRYYQNEGTISQPDFAEYTDQNNPLNGVSVDNSAPTLVDIDNDGDLDAFIGIRVDIRDNDGEIITSRNTIKYYQNTGSASGPVFKEPTDDTTNPLSKVDVENISSLGFVDIDQDGDLDAFGMGTGPIRYYENTGSVSRPVFVERMAQNNPFVNIKEGRVTVVDIDNDGNLEAFLSVAKNGTVDTVKCYQHEYTDFGKQFVEQTNEQNNPFADVKASVISTLVDMDNDGDLDAFIKADDGTVKYYKNTSSVNQPAFVSFSSRNLPLASKPSLVDIDGDGDLDAFFLADDSTAYYENTGTVNRPIFERAEQNNPLADVKEEEVLLYVYQLSQLTLVDFDNDKDLDAFIAANNTVIYYKNTGKVQKPHFKKHTNPLVGVHVGIEETLTLVDIDNDKDVDAFVVTNDTVRFYQNEGMPNHPIFVNRTKQYNPFHGVETYYGSVLTLVDFDNDKDLDAFINVSDSVRYYENMGDASQPKFVERTGQNNPFADVDLPNYNKQLTLVDIDNDGDMDAFIGAGSDQVRYYENIGRVNAPNFIKRIKQENPLAKINVRLFSEPSLVDIDNDSDLDVFIGTNYGTVKHYENMGTVSQPFFVERTEQNNPLANVDVGFDCTPTMVDIDNDSDLDVFIGAQDGTVRYYENTTGTNRLPRFEERTKQNNPLADAKVESSSQPRLIDIDHDGDLDAIINGIAHDEEGKNVYTAKYYENRGTSSSPRFVELTAQNNLLAGINAEINTEWFSKPPTLVDIDNDGDLDVFIIDDNKRIVRYYENTGTVSQPSFVEHTEQNHLVGINTTYSPSFVDIDHDGDLDAFFVGFDMRYYENTGAVSQPNFVESAQQDYSWWGVHTWVDIDNDNDLDAFEVVNGAVSYHENISLASNALPNNYALPKGVFYNSKREVSLNCIDCEKIYYTLDGTKPTTDSMEYVLPLEITQNTTLKFVTVDAQSKLSKVQTETYLIDTTLPEITINSPASDSSFKTMPSIQGTAFDSEDGVGLDRIELKVNNGSLYISRDSNNPFTASLTWLPLTTRSDQWSYDVSEEVHSFPTGNYTITARAFDRAGNVAEDTLKVTIGEQAYTKLFIELNNSTILKNDTLNVTGKLNRLPESDKDLSGLPIKLTIIAPDGTTRTETEETHSNTGQYEFIDLDGFTQKGKYTFKTTFAAVSLLKESESIEESVLVGKSAGYAIIVQGKLANEEGLAAHNKTTNRIYHKLRKRRVEDDNIYYFNYNFAQDGVDDIPSKAAIQAAFADLSDKMKGSPGPFYLIMVDHGGREGHFYIDNDGDNETITPPEIAEWLNTLEQALNENALAEPRIVILGYCYSGSFIPELSGSNRVIITSAAADEVSYKGPKEPDDIRTGEFFMEALFQRLGRGASFKDAFETATDLTEIYTRRGGNSANLDNPYFDNAAQHPLVDSNGDEQGSNVLSAEIGDGPNLAELYLGAGADLITNSESERAAKILSVTETRYLTPEQSSTDLYIKVNNANRVNGAPVDIRQPSIVLTTDDQDEYTEQREIEGVLRVDGDLRCSNVTDYCDKPVDVFEEPGQYEVFYFVRDRETNDISPIERSVVYKNKAGNQAPDSFELLSPFAGVEPPPATTLRFYWDDTSDPDGDPFTYTLLIAADEEDFDNSVVYKQEELRVTTTFIDNQANVIDEETEKSRQGLKDLTKYYWAVEAIDNFGAKTRSDIFSFTPDNTNAPHRDDSADVDSTLGNSIAINGDGNRLATKAVFYLTMVNGDWVPLGSTLSEHVVMTGHITVDSAHRGKTADILTVISYTPTDGEEAQFFMMDDQKQYQPWDLDLAELVATEKSIPLPVQYTVPIDSRDFVGIGAGSFHIFYGYRLENDVIVYNEVQPVVEYSGTTD